MQMPYTVPNQKTITIHRAPLDNNFLGINNDNWKYAARVLGAQAFLLYIYFASNKPDFVLALSPKAIQKEIGMPPSTFRDQLTKLETFGFLRQGEGNRLHFYEVPPRATRFENARDALNSTEEKTAAVVQGSTPLASQTPPEDKEIYINKKIGETNTPEGMNESAFLKGNDNPIAKGFKF